MDGDNRIEVEDGEGFNFSEVGIKEIALEQYRRCCVEGSKEMNRGGATTKFVGGKWIDVDIPNQREVFINCVGMLHIVLLPDLAKKDKLLTELQDIDKEMKEKEGEASDKYKEIDVQYKTDKKIDWDKNIDKLNDHLELQKVSLSQKKLMTLSLLLKELNYFKEMGGTN